MLIITGSKMIWSNFTNAIAYGILELIAYATSEGSDELWQDYVDAHHPHSLAKAAYTHKQGLYK